MLITCIVVAATSGALRERFDGFQRIGNIIGTSIRWVMPIYSTFSAVEWSYMLTMVGLERRILVASVCW